MTDNAEHDLVSCGLANINILGHLLIGWKISTIVYFKQILCNTQIHSRTLATLIIVDYVHDVGVLYICTYCAFAFFIWAAFHMLFLLTD